MKTLLGCLVLIALVLAVCDVAGLDIYLQDRLYDSRHHHWLLARDEPVARFLLYDGIKALFVLLECGLLIALLVFRKKPLIKRHQRGLWIVALSVICVPVIVGELKSLSNVPCPRDLNRYGGSETYVTVLDSYPHEFRQSNSYRCFPAGHASGGFSLFGLAFLFACRRRRVMALVAALSVGWATGVYKMLIGDHFASHTAISMLLAWVVVSAVAGGVHWIADRHRAGSLRWPLQSSAERE
jgi:membrane-associated PAP2 superfamily phosphatase